MLHPTGRFVQKLFCPVVKDPHEKYDVQISEHNPQTLIQIPTSGYCQWKAIVIALPRCFADDKNMHYRQFSLFLFAHMRKANVLWIYV